ncbi:MAG: multidrug effflux MFS transporter [Coxiellaceae bacterium]|nr:multidrug effflux MFS transporter [Coxiellaceae bacterium]
MFTSKRFDLILLLLAPLITLVNGIAIDLYTPSLPAIAHSFAISASLAKFTVSISMIGFGIGVFTFGGLSDNWGRRYIILAGLSLFMLASVLGMNATNIDTLLVARFLQGFGVAMAAMLARATLVDHFTGKQLQAAMLYTTIAWGLGPVIAPAIGGYIQQYFDWQANFILYTAVSAFVLLASVLFLNETLPSHKRNNQSPLTRYKAVLSNHQFQLFAAVCVLCFTGFVSYGIVGPFVVQTQLHYDPVTFGHTALMVGAGYLGSTLINRVLITRFKSSTIVNAGIGLIIVSGLLLWYFVFSHNLTLVSFVTPFVILTAGVGLIFPNAITQCLAPFTTNAGSAACLHGGVVMTLGSITTGLVGLIPIHSLLPIALVVTGIAVGVTVLMNIYIITTRDDGGQ